MQIIQILLIFALFLSQGLGDEVFRKRGESSAKSTQNRQDSAYQKRIDSTRNTTKRRIKKDEAQKSDSPKITPKNTSDSQIKARDSKDLKIDSQPKAINQFPKNQKTTQDSKDSQSPKTANQSTKKPTQSKSIKIKRLTDKKKQLGYRNVTIKKIKKQQKVGIDFFVGLQFGIDIVSTQELSENANGDKTTKSKMSGSASFGLKGGIISEDEWVGGRFYAELSYLKIPKFDMLNIGVNLDLLVKYYETPSWKIGGFIGAGGGMNSAFVADKSLDSAGTKSLISVGWVNIGLVRFIYGNHGAELNAKIVYVTPTIYGLKDKNTGITTSYKGSSSTVMLSYIYQF